MKTWIVIAVVACLGVAHSALADGAKAPEQKVAATKQDIALPVYKPPLRGAPAAKRLVGGGSRSAFPDAPSVTVLAPEHTGLTTKSQPTLFFHLSKPTNARVELTVIEEGAVHPLAEIAMTGLQSAGVLSVNLDKHGVNLKPDVAYEWWVAVVPDPEQRSHDIISRGSLLKAEPSAVLREELAQASPEELPFIYAENGFWYDALEAVSALIETRAENKVFKMQRASLLEQVALKDVTKHEMSTSAVSVLSQPQRPRTQVD